MADYPGAGPLVALDRCYEEMEMTDFDFTPADVIMLREDQAEVDRIVDFDDVCAEVDRLRRELRWWRWYGLCSTVSVAALVGVIVKLCVTWGR